MSTHAMSTKCGFKKAWTDPCSNPTPCDKHENAKCVSCGNPATRECDETGQFVCGALLCNDCEHTIAKDGTNGGVGFERVSPYPDGFSAHCKKADQIYMPWYVGELWLNYIWEKRLRAIAKATAGYS